MYHVKFFPAVRLNAAVHANKERQCTHWDTLWQAGWGSRVTSSRPLLPLRLLPGDSVLLFNVFLHWYFSRAATLSHSHLGGFYNKISERRH
jgi:hypothetical protein